MNGRQQKCISKLQNYDFDIEYVKGKNNVVADALFGIPILCTMFDISIDWRATKIVDYTRYTFVTNFLDGKLQDERFKVANDLIFTMIEFISSQN